MVESYDKKKYMCWACGDEPKATNSKGDRISSYGKECISDRGKINRDSLQPMSWKEYREFRRSMGWVTPDWFGHQWTD